MKRIKIIGSQQNSREYLYEALALAASGKVRVMTETYRLDEIGKAYGASKRAGAIPRGRHDVACPAPHRAIA